MEKQGKGLSNIQEELLKLYANNVSDKELADIKILLSRYFANKDSDEMEVFLRGPESNEDRAAKWSAQPGKFKTSDRPML